MLLALIEYLTGVSSLTALISADNMQPMAMKKGTLRPYLTISRISRNDTQDLGGKATFCQGDLWEIDVVTDSASAGEIFREALRVKLATYNGNMGTTSAVYVTSVTAENGFDFTESLQDGSDDYAYHTPSLFSFTYTQVDSDV